MRLIYNSDAQRLQKNFDDKTPITVSELFRSERTASVPIELFLIDTDGGYATPGTSDYEVLIGRQAQAITTGKLTLTFTGTTEEIDLSKPKLATRIEAALNAVSEVNAAGGVDVVELNNGRAFQITFRSVGSRAAITAGVKDSMQPASVIISEVTAGTGSTREVQLLTLEEASLAEVSTSGWSANSNPALAISTLVEGTANTREVVQLSVTGDPAPGSFFVVSNSEPISTEATAAQVKSILNSALSNDIGSVKKTGERIWQITYKTNGDKTALSAGTHNLVKRPSVNATLSLNTTALAYAANSDGSDLSVGFTLKKSNEVLLSENVDLAEPFAEVIGSSAMLNNDSLGALFTIGGNDVNKGTAISLSGGLTYSSDTLGVPLANYLPLAGGTMTGDAVFNDGVKAIFGTASDGIELYHASNESYIDDSGTGRLFIRSNGSGVFLQKTDGENLAKFKTDGATELYFDGSKKIESTNLGCTISGKLIVNGDLDVSGTTTTFNSTVVTVDDPVFTVGGDTAPVASDNKDRGIEFRYFRSGESAKVGFFGYSNADDAFKLLTSATNSSEVFSGTLADLKCGNILLADNKKIYFGDNSDLTIEHTGSDSVISDSSGTGGIKIDTNYLQIRNASGTESQAKFIENGAVELNYDNSKKLETTTDGISVTGTIQSSDGSASAPSVSFSSDTDTGIFRPTANTLAFTTSGTEAARFDSSGELITKNKIKIEHATPVFELKDTSSGATSTITLDGVSTTINNQGTGGNLIFSTQGTEAARFDSSGNFIINDSNEIKNNTSHLRFSTGSQDNNNIVFKPNGTLQMTLTDTGLGIGNSATMSVANAQRLVVGDGAGAEGITIYSGSDNAGYLYFADGTSGDQSYRGQINYNQTSDRFTFHTAAVERMRLNSTGLGIGGAPSYPLVVKSTSASHQVVAVNRPDSDTAALFLGNNSGLNGIISANNSDLLFGKDFGNTFFEGFRLDTNGHLRVGNGTRIYLWRDNNQNYLNYNTWLATTGAEQLIENNGTGGIHLKASGTDSDIVFSASDGTLNEIMRLDGSASSINVPDDVMLKVGSGGLSMEHKSNNETWNYYSSASGHAIYAHGGQDQDFIFKTTPSSTGSQTELLRLDGSTSSINVPDDISIKVGSSGDLTLYSNNANLHYDHYNLNTVFRHFGTDKDFIWYTTTGGTISEVLRLDGSTGNVGIGGVTNPSRTIHVNGGLANIVARIESTDTGAYMSFTDNSTNDDASVRIGANANAMQFFTSGNERLRINASGAIGIDTTSPTNNADLTLGNGELCMAETTTPTADANFGKIYCKADNKLYFQDGAGTEHEIAFA